MARLSRLMAMVVPTAALMLAANFADAAQPSSTSGTTQFTGGLRFASDDLNLGLGARGGYSFPGGAYVGGTFDYFLGDEDQVTIFGAQTTVDSSLWMLAAEGGYDFGLTPALVVRPFGGLGVARAFGESCSQAGTFRNCEDFSDTDPTVIFGGLLYYVSGALIVGPELRIIVVSGDAAFSIGGNVGARF